MATRRPKLAYVDDNRRSIVAAQRSDMPAFMHPIELAQYVGIVAATGPKRVLEWGSGGSTATLLNLFPTIATYVAIEHNHAWYEKVKNAVSDPRLEIHHVAPAEPEPVIPKSTTGKARRTMLLDWFARCENEPALMADYVARPGTLYDSYDLILVDGRARTHCLRAGWDLLSSGGVLVIHDAQRAAYHPTVAALPNHLYLEPWVQGQICLSRKP